MIADLNSAYYDLADLLGMSLERKDNRVTGKAQLAADYGVCRVDISVRVFSSLYEDLTNCCALLVAGPGDLGLFVQFDPRDLHTEVHVVDRAHMPERGKGLFEGAKCTSTKECRTHVLQFARACFEGPVRGPFVNLAK